MNASSLTLLVAATAILTACSSETNDPPGQDPSRETPVQAPSQSSDVESVYGQIGNACNDGSLTRSFDVAAATRSSNLWSVPADDPAALRGSKISGKWSELVSVSTLDFNGIAESFQTTSSDQAARCGAAREIFTPLADGDRRSFLNLLLYADAHPHLDSVPEGTPSPASAQVRLRGYLDVASGRPETTEGGVLYRDVAHQYVPLYVRCDAPLSVAYEITRVSDADYASLDPSACRARSGEGEGYDCVQEKLVHPASNRCTFVAVSAKFVTASGKKQSLSLGGKLETTRADPVRYTMTVDRYRFDGE